MCFTVVYSTHTEYFVVYLSIVHGIVCNGLALWYFSSKSVLGEIFIELFKRRTLSKSRCYGFTRVNALTTGNPFFTILLEVSIGRDFGALKGLRVRGPQ